MVVTGPLPRVTSQFKFVITAVDYLTKWVEVASLAKITEQRISKFIWKNMICKYGVSYVIVMDNMKQFNNHRFSQERPQRKEVRAFVECRTFEETLPVSP